MMNLQKRKAFKASLRLGIALLITGQSSSFLHAQNAPRFPGETSPIEPIGSINVPGLPQNAADYTVVSEVHFKYANQIPSAGDRSLALSRLASTATFSSQLDMAEKSVIAAADAALLIPEGLVRDQRLISTVAALLELAEVRIRDGVDNSSTTDPVSLSGKKIDRNDLIRKAVIDWKLAADLAQKVQNKTYQNEMMYRVCDGMGSGSQSIVNDFPRTDEAAGGPEKSARGFDLSYVGLPDRILQDAAAYGLKIDRPVWRDRAMVSVSNAASGSRQFDRAVDIARLIPQPEVRTDALLKIAENQAKKNDASGATATYREAAIAVASIPLADPRAVLAGVLIDSLLSVGRFEDARASVVLYPDEARRLIALGAIAESMGKRGLAQTALVWINRETTEPARSHLYRRVSNGVVSAIVNNRTNRELDK